ncbi:flagellar hook-associated protein FlgK [Paenibacillus fonticola]|uniref:flagellar hook-associated protein FlgK n=1 Tax=Paenibacillus fonticola TaxID=379896 RepID=UPI0003685A7A|nr:flagellar hook-associated protein FlgK [Paenibacillus fonticola]
MASTFHSIETAKRSLFTQTAALNTTGHNISNANTPGFSRQVVNMQASSPIEALGLNRTTAPGQLGTGVEFSSITRIRNTFLDREYRGEAEAYGTWKAQAETLSKLEGIMNEPSDTGLRVVMDNFWKAWSDLSKDPESITARKIVIERAQAMTDALNYMSQQLDNLSQDLLDNVLIKETEIIGYLSSINDLNESIIKLENLGDNANDLRDQRDLLTDKLSQIVNITVTENEQGYNITMGNTPLLQGRAVQVQPSTGGDPATSFLVQSFAAGSLSGGEVHGMLVSRNQYVTDYKAKLDNLTNTMLNGTIANLPIPAGSMLPEGTIVKIDTTVTVNGTDQVVAAGSPLPANAVLRTATEIDVAGFNGLHQLGFTLNGTTDRGLPFFEGTNAGNIRLNTLIANDPKLIATSLRTEASGTGQVVVKGNNTLALVFSSLNEFKFTAQDGSQSTLNSQYSAMVGQLGIQAQEANRQAENSSILITQVDTQRQSVSGVSLDEEMSNMIKFQHAYSAAARFMTTFDQLLDKLINSTGIVGR